MTAQYGNDIQTHTIDTHHSRICVLVFNIRGDGTYTDSHGADEHKAIELVPLLADIRALNDLGTEFTLEDLRNILACLTDLYNSYHIRLQFDNLRFTIDEPLISRWDGYR